MKNDSRFTPAVTRDLPIILEAIAEEWLRFATMDIVSARHLCSLHPISDISDTDSDSALVDASFVLEICTAHIRKLRSSS